MSKVTDNGTNMKIIPLQKNEGDERMESMVINEDFNEFKEISIEKKHADEENPSPNVAVNIVMTEKEDAPLNVITPREVDNVIDKEAWKFKGIAELELTWTNIRVATQLPKKKGKPVEEKVILNNVSGTIRSGEALAIIGSSGAGKTTLLNLLSRKIESKNLVREGEILLNNQYIDNNKFDSIVSYVMQDDILEPLMSPLETLLFTAKLKLNLPMEEIERKVDQMLTDLNLHKCKHTNVGDAIIRGVSGGERKRTSIGVELITDPKIVFLDEPTTGLDSYNAYEVIILLRRLAASGKLIVFTIHQPSSEIYELLDKLCILALGKTVYFGSQEKCFDNFERINLPMPVNYNPFEHFIEMTTQHAIENPKVLSVYPALAEIENKQERYGKFVDIIAKNYDSHVDDYIEKKERLKEFSKETQMMFQNKGESKSMWYEFCLLFGRALILTLRNPKLFKVKIIQSIFTGVLISVLFINVIIFK